MSDDKLGHLAATFSQLEERIGSLTRELAEAQERAARWKRISDSLEERLFRRMHEVCQEQRESDAREAQDLWGIRAARCIRDAPLVIEAEDCQGNDGIGDVPPKGGGLT